MFSHTVRFASLVLIFVLLLLTGCGHGAPTVRDPQQYVIFIDQSDSIGAEQRVLLQASGKVLLRSIRGGDALIIFALHDRTGDAGALFDSTFPPLPPHPTIEQSREFNAMLRRAYSALKNALETTSPSRQTDLFSAFDRCKSSRYGRSTVVFLSDMLHVTRDFNMERKPVRDADMPALIEHLAQQHRWDSATLQGTSLYVVLPSIEKNAPGPRPANDRPSLHRFYEALATSLGGRLVSFDTQIRPGELL